ncbi:hypothetical protein SAMN05216436_1511, partial [bacterium A37T11]
KFDIRKAFGMLYDITTSKKGANSIWLAERYGGYFGGIGSSSLLVKVY